MMPTFNPYTLKAEAKCVFETSLVYFEFQGGQDSNVRLSKDKNTTRPLKNLLTTFMCSMYFHVHNKHAGIHGRPEAETRSLRTRVTGSSVRQPVLSTLSPTPITITFSNVVF